jgi:hypothetical protein
MASTGRASHLPMILSWIEQKDPSQLFGNKTKGKLELKGIMRLVKIFLGKGDLKRRGQNRSAER